MIDIEIPGYKIEKELGRGGMATVYLAMQESMQRHVALKVMLPQLAASDPSFSERFLREARIVAQLSHPNIIAVFDVGVAGNYHYFSMEFHTGGDLKDRIKHGIPVKQAFDIARALASALDYAHGKGYIHRDMKPENVLFRHDGSPVLTDFGIAKAHDSTTRMTATGAVIGTPHYMSPEQAQGQELDNRSDLYSLGVVIFEMLVGAVPYQGTSALSIGIKHLKEPIPQLPATQQQFQPLINRLLAKNPDDRFQTGAEMIQAMDTLMSGQALPDISGAATIVAGAVDTSAATVQMTATTAQQTRVTAPQTRVPQTTAKSSGGIGKILATVILLAGMGAGAWWYLNEQKTVPAPVASTTPPPSRVDPSADIDRLIASAKKAVADNRRVEPENNNALYFYRQALALDANHAAAKNGLTELSSYYVGQAEDAIENRKLDDAGDLLAVAEEIDAANPLIFSRRLALKEAREKQAATASARENNNARLARERETAKARAAEREKAEVEAQRRAEAARAQQESAQREAQRRAQEQKDKINNLIAQAETYLAPGSLSNTRIALANDLYQQAAQLAPSDSRARQGKQKVADAYMAVATQKLEQKEYDEADRAVASGLNLQPTHTGLLSLKTQIAEARSKPRRRTFGGF